VGALFYRFFLEGGHVMKKVFLFMVVAVVLSLVLGCAGELRREYYENGKLKSEIHYKNNEKNGSYKFYYDNERVKVKGNYKNGKLEGKVKEYDENGKLKEEVIYQGGREIKRKSYERRE
jgi:antitoxin component YwqK of YwqJK toxin-antitoxin module